MANGLVQFAAYLFLLGTLMVTASAIPRLSRRWPRLLLNGFLVALSSFALVALATLFQ